MGASHHDAFAPVSTDVAGEDAPVRALVQEDDMDRSAAGLHNEVVKNTPQDAAGGR